MENKVEKNKSTAKKVFDVIVNIVIVLYLIGTVLISVSIFATIGNSNGVPTLFGNSLMNVLTDSMEPVLNEGDLAICQVPKDRYALEVDDVIAFRTSVYIDNETEQSIIKIHRIVEIAEDGSYITAGDNVDEDKNGVPDRDAGTVIATKVLGVYTGNKIPAGGKVFDFLTSQKGIMICLVIPMAVFFIWALFKFIKVIVELKYAKVAENGSELTEEQKQAAIAEYLAKQAAEADKDENNTDN